MHGLMRENDYAPVPVGGSNFESNTGFLEIRHSG